MSRIQSASRSERIMERLNNSFNVIKLALDDESHKHVGHAGASDGRGHYALTISAPEFDDLTAIKRHRLIYDALGDLLESDIHAIRIKAYGSFE